jgi:hypothetical protein
MLSIVVLYVMVPKLQIKARSVNSPKCDLSLTSFFFQHHLLPHSLSGGPLPEKRAKLLPLPHERVMIYVRQETEEAYTPLHLVSGGATPFCQLAVTN